MNLDFVGCLYLLNFQCKFDNGDIFSVYRQQIVLYIQQFFMNTTKDELDLIHKPSHDMLK